MKKNQKMNDVDKNKALNKSKLLVAFILTLAFATGMVGTFAKSDGAFVMAVAFAFIGFIGLFFTSIGK